VRAAPEHGPPAHDAVRRRHVRRGRLPAAREPRHRDERPTHAHRGAARDHGRHAARARRGVAALATASPSGEDGGMSLSMTKAEREAFLADVHVGIVSIPEPGAAPVTAPIWYRYEPGGQIEIITDR